MRISTRSWPDCDWTSEAYLAACCGAAMWSILILMPVSLVKRTAISSSFLSMSGAKLFQQRYEISRCCPRAGAIPAAKMPARLAPVVVVRKRRRVIDAMNPPLSFTARAPFAGAGRRCLRSEQSFEGTGGHRGPDADAETPLDRHDNPTPLIADRRRGPSRRGPRTWRTESRRSDDPRRRRGGRRRADESR